MIGSSTVAPGLDAAPRSDPGAGLSVEELGLREAARTISPEWSELRRRATVLSPFLRPDLLRLWADNTGCMDGCRVVTARRRGELVGVAPFMIDDEPFGPFSVATLRFIGNNVGCPGDLTYADLLTAGPRAPVVTALLERASRWGADRWDFGYLSPDSETCRLAPEILGASPDRNGTSRQPFVSRPLPHSWETFLRQLSGEVRRNFQRRLRRLSEHGSVHVRVAQSDAEVRRTVSELIRNHERWYVDTDREQWFGDESVKRFLVDAAGLLAADGAFLAFALEVGGEPIAWNVGVYDRDRYFEWIASFDRSFRACAPGVLLGTLVIQRLIERGAESIELGPGFDERKRRLGATPTDFPRIQGCRGWVRAATRAYRFFRRGREAS